MLGVSLVSHIEHTFRFHSQLLKSHEPGFQHQATAAHQFDQQQTINFAGSNYERSRGLLQHSPLHWNSIVPQKWIQATVLYFQISPFAAGVDGRPFGVSCDGHQTWLVSKPTIRRVVPENKKNGDEMATRESPDIKSPNM